MRKLNGTRLSTLRRATPFEVSLGGARGVYGSREIGASLFERFWSNLNRFPQDCTIPIDFEKVKLISVSATDEFLCKILQRIRSGELASRYIYIVGASPEVLETLDITLRARQLACIAAGKTSVRIIGDLSEPLQNTLNEVCRRGFATAGELADGMKYSRNKINIVCNRLNVLSKWGLVHREREASPKPGRQYHYHAIL